jgi:cysteine synthase A
MESLNPGGTGKDRAALSMISAAEAAGMLRPGGTVVEGTSGSTGISLAGICNAKGYKCVIFMPDDQAIEKRELLRSLGAEVRTVKPCAISNPGHYVKQAQKYAETHENAVFIDQFENAANADIHYATTGTR